MKVCSKCGVEIDGLDGDNYCQDCDSDTPPKEKKTKKLSRAMHKEAMRDLGLVKVRGKLSGCYWE